MFYRLGYPNREASQSLNRMSGDALRRSAHSARLYDLLLVNDFDGLSELFHAFFASIPHQWYTNNDIAHYEGFYASVFYSYFAGLGVDVTVEDSNSRGRLDMAMRFNGNVYLFEFKVVELAPKGAAMAQLKRRRYADKYRDLGEPIHLVAVEFSREERNLARSRWSALDARERAIEFDAAHLLFRRAHRSPGISASTGLSRPFTGSMPRPKISKVTVPIRPAKGGAPLHPGTPRERVPVGRRAASRFCRSHARLGHLQRARIFWCRGGHAQLFENGTRQNRVSRAGVHNGRDSFVATTLRVGHFQRNGECDHTLPRTSRLM